MPTIEEMIKSIESDVHGSRTTPEMLINMIRVLKGELDDFSDLEIVLNVPTLVEGIDVSWLRIGPFYSIWFSGAVANETNFTDGKLTIVDSTIVPALAKYQGDDLKGLAIIESDDSEYNLLMTRLVVSNGGKVYITNMGGLYSQINEGFHITPANGNLFLILI